MTQKLTLPIEIGRRYVRRDGQVVTAEDYEGAVECAFVGDAIVDVQTGRARANPSIDRPYDLIADAPEEPATYAITDYADVLRAIADGRVVEMKPPVISGAWSVQPEEFVLQEIGRGFIPPWNFRIKPDIITINGREVPAPVREVPLRGTKYWVVDFVEERGYDNEIWEDFPAEKRDLSRGLIHLTEDAARQHAEALLSFTRREG